MLISHGDCDGALGAFDEFISPLPNIFAPENRPMKCHLPTVNLRVRFVSFLGFVYKVIFYGFYHGKSR